MSSLATLVLLAMIAALYASVGHGGASGYLALMALLGHSQDVMRPSALMMNLFVSAIAFAQFARAGHFRWNLFWPFAIASVPMAFLGAQVTLDPLVYKRILALCLLFAVGRLFGLFGNTSTTQVTVRLPLAVLIGAALGLVSGMIGIGGGILLSPAILLLRWADVKETAGVSALFIFVNSAAGILGAFGSGATIGVDAWGWIAAVIFGGLIGGHIGSNLLKEPRLRQVLGAVLLLASVKLMLP